MNFSDIVNTGLAIRENLGGDTLAAKRLDEAKRLITPSGPTAGSLIRGLIPGRMAGSGGGTRPSPLQITPAGGGGGFTPVQQPVQPVEEPLLPILPTGQPQSGQDPTALADVAQQAYTSALRSYGIDPGFFARIRPRRFNISKGTSFRKAFKRKYFA